MIKKLAEPGALERRCLQLLLRSAVGVTAVVKGGFYLANGGNATLGTWIVGLSAVAIGASLLIGFLTPVAGLLIVLGSAGLALSSYSASIQNLFDTRLSILFLVIMAVAIVLLGPGAFSLDARLFGRREIIIPPRS